MHIGQYVFAQIAQFLPQRHFRRIVAKYNDKTRGWSLSHWNHMLVLMFGQLLGCRSLRELTDITIAHGKKSFFLGFGNIPVNRQALSKANAIRDYRIFEEFAFHMVFQAQRRRITRDFTAKSWKVAVGAITFQRRAAQVVEVSRRIRPLLCGPPEAACYAVIHIQISVGIVGSPVDLPRDNSPMLSDQSIPAQPEWRADLMPSEL